MHTVLRGRRFIREILGWCSWGQFQSVMKTMKTFVPRAGGQKWCQPCNEYLFFLIFYFQILCLRETSPLKYCVIQRWKQRENTKMSTMLLHVSLYIVCRCVRPPPSTCLSPFILLFLTSQLIADGLLCRQIALEHVPVWIGGLLWAWRHIATGTRTHSICWPSCSVLEVQHKTICPLGMFRGPSSEMMCVKGLSKISTGIFFDTEPQITYPITYVEPRNHFRPTSNLWPEWWLNSPWTYRNHKTMLASCNCNLQVLQSLAQEASLWYRVQNEFL